MIFTDVVAASVKEQNDTNELHAKFKYYIVANIFNLRCRWVYSGPPQLNTSVQHKRATPFQPPKSVSSTPKTKVQVRFKEELLVLK